MDLKRIAVNSARLGQPQLSKQIYDKRTMKVQSIIFGLCLLTLNTSVFASESTSKELRRLHKCYGLFVREKISSNDVLWKQVQAGQKTGTDACMEIFDKAQLDKNGQIKKGPDGQYDYEGMQVLNTFMRFLKSQLDVPDFATPIGTGVVKYTRDITDSNEATYHLLYSLFNSEEKYSNIVTRDYSLKSIRYSSKAERKRSVASGATTLLNFTQGFYKNVLDANGVTKTIPDDAKGLNDLPLDLPETGILVGLERDERDNSLQIDPFISFKFTSSNINQHHGGGIMGTQSYLHANAGKDGNTDGAGLVHRRWGKHVMADLLCRDLPALRSSDVVSEVNIKSNISFRQGISCMGCHSSMDPLAGVTRNLRQGFTHNSGLISPRVSYWGYRPADMEDAPYPSATRDANFYRRPASGRLYYRSYDGKLVKYNVVGMNQLGEAMASTNDLYVCAAKRYYKFLTSINVSLADEGDINTPAFSDAEFKYRQRIIKLGLELKKHQSLRTMIKSIISTETFISPDQGV